MTNSERMKALQKWVFAQVCQGKSMKTPSDDDMTPATAEPKCFIGNYPQRLTENESQYNVAPSIVLVNGLSRGKEMDEARFDRYAGIKRPQELGATLAVQFVCVTYDPGNRNEDAQESGSPDDVTYDADEGYLTLLDWLEEIERALLGVKAIPETDLFVWESSVKWSPLMVQDSVADRRPLYYGYVTCEFGHYANENVNPAVQAILSD